MSQNQLLLSRARQAALARDFVLATRLYRQLLRNDRNNVSLLTELGNLFIKSGNDEQALPVFKRIAELDKKNLDVYITLGGIYRRLKKYDESVAVLEQSLLIDEDNPQILYNLGFTYKIMGDTENAISFFEDTIDRNPDDVLAYNHIGTIYADQDEHEKAIQYYLRGLNVDANHPVLLMNLAKSYEATGEYKKACEAYAHALRSRPFWTDVIEDYSYLLVKLNRADDAYILVSRAVNANPKDEKLRANLEYVEQFVEKDSKEKLQEIAADSEIKEPEETAEAEKPAETETEETSPETEENATEDDATETEEEISDTEPAPEVEEEAEEPEEPNLDALKDEDSEDFDFNAFGDDDFTEDELTERSEEENEGETSEEEDSLAAEIDSDGELSDAEDVSDTQAPSPEAEEEAGENRTPFSVTMPASDTAFPQTAAETDLSAVPENPGVTAENADNNSPAATSARDSVQIFADSADTAAAKNETENETEDLQELPAESFEEEIFADDSPVFGNTDSEQTFAELEEMPPEDLVTELTADDGAEGKNPRLALFVKIRELLKYLPEDKKTEYQSSEARLMLDYLILKLSGEKGLLKKAEALEVKFTEQTETPHGNLLEEGLKIIRKLIEQLPDKNLVYAMEQQLKKVER